MAVEDTLDRIIAKNKERNAQRSSQVTELQRHGEIIDMGLQQQETIVKVVRSLVSFLERHTSKTEVTNQLESIGTPDALKVVTAVEDLHKTLKTHENTDLTEITDVMKQVLTQLEQVPKEYQEITIPETVKVSNMPDHSKDMKALLEAVKAIKLVAEAPQVTVEPTPVQIDPTDVSPVTGAVEKATKAIKAIVIPQPESLKKVEKLIAKTNSLLNELLDASPSGGGGGGSAWIAVDENDKPTPIQLSNGAVPIVISASTISDFVVNDIDAGAVSYYGKTSVSGAFLVQKITDETVLYATIANNGSISSYADAWINRSTLTYGRYDQAF